MDHQWHLRPVQGNICPTCSISHFPHCPPLPSFNPNPRYPSPHDYSLQRPGFDPYIGSTSSVPYHPNSEYRDPNLGHRNPNFDRDLQGHGAYPSRVSYDHSNSNGFINGVDRNNKRIRVDEMGSGAFVNEFHGNLSRVVSEEDERRLKLIRDHGCALGGPSQNGLNPTFGAGSGFNHESAISERRYGDIGIWEHGNFDDLRGGRGENALKLPGGYSSREDRSLGFGQQSMQSNRSGPNDVGDRYYSASQKADLNRQGLVPRNGDYLIGEFPNENYGSQNIQQLQPKEFISGALYNEQRSSLPMENRGSNNQPLQSREGNLFPVGHQSFHVTAQHVLPNINNQASYSPLPTGGSMVSENPSQMHASRVYNAQPPLPSSPPPPPPMEPPGNTSSELKASYFPPKTSPSLLPVHNKDTHSVSSSSYPPVSEAHYMSQPYFQNGTHSPASIGFTAEESHAIRQTWSRQYMGEGQLFPPKHISSDDRKLIDGSQLFKQPHRSARPDHIVIILRGLPGSGKSYLAKMLRDLEVENGGDAPRIHSMDDYFMTEVEKVDENEMSKSTSSGRGKKPIMKKVMEYCYEPEMEEAYRSSMLKAFKKTLEEGVFTFIIVDDRNLRVADFAQFWAIAKRSGYEVYLLEAPYKDPVGCAARNVHGFTQEEIQNMAGQWEEAPSFYLQLDIKSLFHGDDLKDNGIQEVDMDMEDRNIDECLSGSPICRPEIAAASSTGDRDHATAGSSKDLESWGADIAEGDHSIEEVKELGRSKWSEDLDEDDGVRTEGAKVFKNSLSGLVQAYGKEAKSVQWGDKAGNTGFAIGAAKKAKMMSLVIGPGAGYNLKSNPLREEENSTSQQSVELKRRSVFEERLRAEHESFKAIFDRRRHRIGLDADEDS